MSDKFEQDTEKSKQAAGRRFAVEGAVLGGDPPEEESRKFHLGIGMFLRSVVDADIARPIFWILGFVAIIIVGLMTYGVV